MDTQSPKIEVHAYVFLLMILVSVSIGVAVADPMYTMGGSAIKSESEKTEWLSTMSKRVESRIPDIDARMEFLKVVLYESNRAELNPQLVLSLIDVASGFKKYAVSQGGARGYMQVAPSWLKTIGAPDSNLFHLRTNIRYGCALLRYFIDFEKGDLMKALGRYRTQMGQVVGTGSAPVVEDLEFPRKVDLRSKAHWGYEGSHSRE